MTILRPAILAIALNALTLLAACNDNDAAAPPTAANPSSSSPQATSEPRASGNPAKSSGDPHGDGHADDDHEEAGGDHAGEGHDDEHAGEPMRLSDAERKAAGIRLAEASIDAVADEITVPATVQPDQGRVAHVAPKVAGRIVRVHVRQGDRVKQGQTLATVDSIEVGEAQAAYTEARAQLDLASSSFERARALFEEQIIPQKEWLQAQADLEKARAAERAAAGRLRLLGVQRPTAQGELSSVYTLTAPFAGTVIELESAVQGELAKPEASLFTVADLSHVWAQASLPEADLGRIHVGSAAAIEVAAYPGERFEGKVTYLSSALDKETRTVQARIEVPNHKGRLKMEMFATAYIEAGAGQDQALVVPREAVVLMEGKPAVFVQEDGAFEVRSVELGQALARGTVIRAGVEPGERVVVAGAYALKARMLKSLMGEGHAH